MTTSSISGGSEASDHSRIGRPATSSIGFGTARVWGRSLVPRPAAMITACISFFVFVAFGGRADRAVQGGGADGGDERIKGAVEDLGDVVPGLLDAVVGDAVLGKVVRADLLRTLAGADLALAQRLFRGA